MASGSRHRRKHGKGRRKRGSKYRKNLRNRRRKKN
jgi:hypothetical protein